MPQPAALVFPNLHPRTKKCTAGFTLLEMIVVIVLIGILSIAIVPRMTATQSINNRGFSDQLKAAVEFARKSAVASRRNVCVTFSAALITLNRAPVAGSAAACTVALVNPATGSAYTLVPPAGVTVASSNTTLIFSGLGSANVDTSVTLTGDATQGFAVVANTGYVQ